ncbi:MAG TPA: hypothetical protein VNN79_12595 [Actinomycetota bacterium]|nr:hypothetical protein [Actinomycetota bacterium]
MSRGKTRRRRARTAAAARQGARPTPPGNAVQPAAAGARSAAPDPAVENRVVAARRRARFAKAVIGATGAAVFAGAMMMARTSYPGHAKTPAKPLGAPPRFVRIVRKNLLQAGIVAPAEAPPGASTSVS